MPLWVGIVEGVAILALLAALIGVSASHSGSNTATPTGLPAGTSLESFQTSVKAQLVAPEPKGFDVKSAQSVICNPPRTWAIAASFICYVYKGTAEIGEVSGTVEATQPGYDWNANLHWLPN